MNGRIFFCAAAAVICSFGSCSGGNEDLGDPVGTVTLNMMNQDNGRTMLGSSDVYIDKADNFHGFACIIAELGQKSGLGAVSTPVLNGIAYEVAVKPGCAYQVFQKDLIRRFPSGNYALEIDSYYYNVYVVSRIEKEGVTTGAMVKYVSVDTPVRGLPEFNSDIGNLNNPMEDLHIDLPTSDFEYTLLDDNGQVRCVKEGKRLVVSLEDGNNVQGTFGIYIRIRESYTYVRGTVW